MNVPLLRALLAMQEQSPVVVEVSEGAARRLRELVEAPEPSVVMATTREDPLDALSQKMEELYTIFTPPRGRVVSQAKGPNRAADRARGIYGKRGKK